MSNKKNRKYNKVKKFGESKKRMLIRNEQRMTDRIDNIDGYYENQAIIKYAQSKGVSIKDIALEMNKDESKISNDLKFQMSPQKIKNYCDAIDRASLKLKCSVSVV